MSECRNLFPEGGCTFEASDECMAKIYNHTHQEETRRAYPGVLRPFRGTVPIKKDRYKAALLLPSMDAAVYTINAF
jgi:hypothetical protein